MSEFTGSDERQITPNITLCCISEEANDLLDIIMEEWGKWEPKLIQNAPGGYTPSHYSFAYWLVRYSGLVQPAKDGE